jgi:hypothetical protein
MAIISASLVLGGLTTSAATEENTLATVRREFAVVSPSPTQLAMSWD